MKAMHLDLACFIKGRCNLVVKPLIKIKQLVSDFVFHVDKLGRWGTVGGDVWRFVVAGEGLLFGRRLSLNQTNARPIGYEPVAAVDAADPHGRVLVTDDNPRNPEVDAFEPNFNRLVDREFFCQSLSHFSKSNASIISFIKSSDKKKVSCIIKSESF